MTEIFMNTCIPCFTGFHDDCYAPEWGGGDIVNCCCGGVDAVLAAASGASVSRGTHGEVGRPEKPLSEIKDVVSAGRKRAAQVAPIFPGMVCEWAGLRYAGGGVVPIVGCRGNQIQEKGGSNPDFLQGDRHHGPHKSTLQNGQGNLHRICASCHSRWHAVNDEFYESRPDTEDVYEPAVPYYLHDWKTKADEGDLVDAESYWNLSPAYRAQNPYAEMFPPDGELIAPGSRFGGRYATLTELDPFA